MVEEISESLHRMERMLSQLKSTRRVSQDISKRQDDIQGMIDSYSRRSFFTLPPLPVSTETQSSLPSSSVLEQQEALEAEKALLEVKKQIVFREIESLDDPRVVALLNAFEVHTSVMASEKKAVEMHQRMLELREQKLSEREQDFLVRTKNLEQQKHNLNREVVMLDEQKKSLDAEIKQKIQHRTQIDDVIKERGGLLETIEQKIAQAKTELRKLQDQLVADRKIVDSSHAQLELERQKVEDEKKIIDDKKAQMEARVSSLSSEAKKEIEEYRKRISLELSDQMISLESRAKELQQQELQLKTLEASLVQREQDIANASKKVEDQVHQLLNREQSAKEKLSRLENQEQLLQRKNQELADMETNMNSLHTAVQQQSSQLSQKQKSLDSELVYLQNLRKSAQDELKLKELFARMYVALSHNDAHEARSAFHEAKQVYDGASVQLKSTYGSLLKEIHAKLTVSTSRK